MRSLIRLLVVIGLLLSATSLAPLALADETTPPPAADTTTDPTADTTTDPTAGTTSPPSTQIDSSPDGSTTESASATVKFHADQAGVTFECKVSGPGHETDTLAECPADDPQPAAAPDAPATTYGTKAYSNLAPGTYTFTVQATTNGLTGDPKSATWTVTTRTEPTPATSAPRTVVVSGPGPRTLKRAFPIIFETREQTVAEKVTFECALATGGALPPESAFRNCDVQPANVSVIPARGRDDLSGLKAGSYVFSVRARTASAPEAGKAAVYPFTVYDDCTTLVTKCPVFSPDHYSPPGGASFNNPTGTVSSQRKNLTHVIRTINSMPGFRRPTGVHCSSNPALFAGTIRVSLYSATDLAFANALVNASRRCLSVQILMNNHLTADNTRAIKVMQTALGLNTSSRSFAYRCSAGCRGRGVEHSKFYLFNSTVPNARITNTVMVGSSNMTSNAAKVQWNDLYTVRSNGSLHQQFSSVFDRMKRDVSEARLLQYVDASGAYQATFWPQAAGTVDPTISALRSIHCTGATGGTGINGRTVVYINMHAWFEKRGTAIASQVRSLYNQGCYVRILYSFTTRKLLRQLTAGTGARMSARRTLFSKHGVYATLYSHHKMFAASGNVGSDTSSQVVWTGSNNFTNGGPQFDEVMLRIRSAAAFNQYRNQFNYIQARRSSAVWATFQEPRGGGRAPVPEEKALRAG